MAPEIKSCVHLGDILLYRVAWQSLVGEVVWGALLS